MDKFISIQSKLIGDHPVKSLFSEWLIHDDIHYTENKIHRKLTSNDSVRKHAIEEISNWIIQHHVADKKIKRLKRRKELILKKYGFEEYVQNQNLLPIAEKTMRGNAAEIILSEYLQETSLFEPLIYRLRFNPNVNQSMKGDDVLLFNLENLQEKVIVGESKFRKTPNRDVVKEITDEFGKQIKRPLSILFVADRISDLGNENLASELEDLNIEIEKKNIPIVNVGFLFSNKNTFSNVERNLVSKNPNFLFLSLGMENPDEFLTECYHVANEKLKRSILDE